MKLKIGIVIAGICISVALVSITEAHADVDWDCIMSDTYPQCSKSFVNSTQSQIQPQPLTKPSLSKYVVVFGATPDVGYEQIPSYGRVVVVGNVAYTMGHASDTYVKEHSIPLTVASGSDEEYTKANKLEYKCCGDRAIDVLNRMDEGGGSKTGNTGGWVTVVAVVVAVIGMLVPIVAILVRQFLRRSD